MATLEKIRSKSVLLIVIIGVALLAFIVGDALTNSRNLFGDHTTVAKIGGEKIDYTDYQRKMEELNNQLEEMRRNNPQQAANFDTQLLSMIALNQLIDEKLVDKGADRLGIKASSAQLRYYMIDQPSNPKLQQLVMQLQQAGMLQPKEGAQPSQVMAQAYEVIFNPKRNNLTDQQVEPYQRMWLAIESETKQQIRRQTYQRLVMNSVKPNDLDMRNLYNDYVSTASVDYAYKGLGNVDEKKYPVTDAELKAEYDRNKAKDYAVEVPTKAVSFIAVDITPSQADIKQSSALAQQTLKSLRDSTGSLSKDLRKEGVTTMRHKVRMSDLPVGALADYVKRAPYDSVSIVQESIKGFTVVKKGRTSSQVDSIQINIVQVMGDKLPAKVLARLNAGLAADSVASVFPADSVAAQTAQWIPLFNAQGETQALSAQMLDSLNNAGIGRYVTLDQQPQGAVLAAVVKKTAPVEIVEYEEASYVLNPSTATVNDVRNKLEKYIAKNNTPEAFKKNASANGYAVKDYNISAEDPAIPLFSGMQNYYPESRQVVRWIVIDGKPGQISRIYESKDANQPKLYVAAVDAEFEDFIPMEQVKDQLTDNVRRAKAVDAMAKQYSGKGNVAQTAEAMGTDVRSEEQMRFGRTPGIMDSEVVGKILGSKPGKVYVVKGKNGVYVYTVKGNKVESFPYDAANYGQQYMQMFKPDMSKMLRGKKKYTNNIYKFEAGE